MNSKRSGAIAQAAVAITGVVICIVSLWRDIHLFSRDIVRRTGSLKYAYMERWQAEAVYALCIILGGILLIDAIRKMRKQ